MCLINSALSSSLCSTPQCPGDKTKLVLCKTLDSLWAPGLSMSLSSGLFTKKSLWKVFPMEQVYFKTAYGENVTWAVCSLSAPDRLQRGNCSWQPTVAPWTWPVSSLAGPHCELCLQLVRGQGQKQKAECCPWMASFSLDRKGVRLVSPRGAKGPVLAWRGSKYSQRGVGVRGG